jgi:hypothetical protein
MVESGERVQWVRVREEKESVERVLRGEGFEVKVVEASVREEEERRRAEVARRARLFRKVEEVSETREEAVRRTAASWVARLCEKVQSERLHRVFER